MLRNKSTRFLPDGFKPKEFIEQPDFVLKKLCYTDAALDYATVMSSIDLIKRIRGGNWPTPDLTLEEDLIDLGWHQREFEFGTSFAYTVLSPFKDECIGCVYIYPTDKPWLNPPKDADVVVNMWVTEKAYKNGIYPELFGFVKTWISKEWPFNNPHYSNKEIPE
jgi:hypothetical protein